MGLGVGRRGGSGGALLGSRSGRGGLGRWTRGLGSRRGRGRRLFLGRSMLLFWGLGWVVALVWLWWFGLEGEGVGGGLTADD